MKKILILTYCFLFINGIANQALAAPFQNGNFESGFDGWSGIITECDPKDPYCSTTLDTTVNPSTDNDHFSIASNSGPSNSNVAKLQNDDTYWMVTLYQDFTLDTLASGWTMDITFWIKWDPTDSNSDIIAAQLQDANYNDEVDLLSGVQDSDLLAGTWVTQDITSFAQSWGGQEVELSFYIMDTDFSTGDTLLIDNISFEKHAPAPVPEPGTVFLLASGLIGLGATRFRKRSSNKI